MPTPPLTDEVMRETLEAVRKHGSVTEAARALGIPRSSLDSRHRAAIKALGPIVDPDADPGSEGPPGKLNEPIDSRERDGSVAIVTEGKPLALAELYELFGIDPRAWVCRYFKPNAWQGFYKLKDGSGHRKVDLWQTKAVFERVVTDQLRDAMGAAVAEIIDGRRAPSRPARKRRTGQTANLGLYDVHHGLLVSGAETQGQNYDLKIARARVRNAVDDLVDEVFRFDLARVVMPLGNDWMHYDTTKQTTAFGEHRLDADDRYFKVLRVSIESAFYAIDRCLEAGAPEVEVLWIPGNHDYHASFAMALAVKYHYERDKRVKVDVGPRSRKYRRYQGVLLGFEHGTKAKPEVLFRDMAVEAGELWNGATYREFNTGHRHQFEKSEVVPRRRPTNGVSVYIHPTLCEVDAWHQENHFIGDPMKAASCLRYDDVGIRGEHFAWARDD